MKTFSVVFDEPVPKKHSICFKTKQEDAGITSVYIMRTHLAPNFPKKVRVTVEEVEGGDIGHTTT